MTKIFQKNGVYLSHFNKSLLAILMLTIVNLVGCYSTESEQQILATHVDAQPPIREKSTNIGNFTQAMQNSLNSQTLHAQTIAMSSQAQPTQSQTFAENLTTSFARVASQKDDVCPKLVDFQFVSQSIVRQNEKFVNQQCEYLVYLNAGDRLKVTTSGDVKAVLASPVFFNFANGAFVADKFDRHTLRLSYNGTRYQPQNFVYDVIISKNLTSMMVD